jgi:hypothetical protein
MIKSEIKPLLSSNELYKHIISIVYNRLQRVANLLYKP